MTRLDQLVDVVGERLRVDADVALDIDGHAARLLSAGRRLTLEVEAATTLSHLGSGRPEALGLREVAHTLDRLGLTLDVVAPRGPVATIGRDAATGPAARLSGAPIRPGAAAISLLPRAVVPVVLAIAAVLWLATRALRRRSD